MNRGLRRGREYNPLHVPAATKRRARKGKKNGGKGVKDSELAVAKRTNTLTFGSLDPSENLPEISPVATGDGKRYGIALGLGLGVKMSPSLYQSIYKQPPPVKTSKKLLTASCDARKDASDDREATPPADIADACAQGLDTKSSPSAAGALAGNKASKVTISTPAADRERRAETPSDDGEDSPFVTASTSRVRDDLSPIVDDAIVYVKQYIFIDDSSNSPEDQRSKRPRAVSISEESPSRLRSSARPLSWADEVRLTNGPESRASSLPDLDPGWTNPNWSRSQYMSAPASTNDERESSDDDEVEVNALIHELGDDYVFSDEQYAEVLRNLREGTLSTSATCSQTSGAGPSARRPAHRVTVEDVDDEDVPDWVTPPLVTESEDETPVGKGKGRAGNKRRRFAERPNLGVQVDNLRRVDKAKVARRRSSGRFDTSRLEQTPQGFRSGGYLELMQGDGLRASWQTRKSTPAAPHSNPRPTSTRSVSRAGSERAYRPAPVESIDDRAHIVDPSDPSEGEASNATVAL